MAQHATHSNDNKHDNPTELKTALRSSIDHPVSTFDAADSNINDPSRNTNSHKKSIDNSDKDSEWDFKMATLFSIFESTSGHVLREALRASNGDLDQAIPWILSHNSSSSNDIDDTNSATNSAKTTESAKLTSFSASPSSTPARKKQKLIQPRLSLFMPTPTSSSSLSVFKQGISPASGHRQQTSHGNTNSSVDDDTSSTPLPSLNDRLRWKEATPNDTNVSTATTDTSTPSSTPLVKLKPPKPLILYNPEDVSKHCPCTLIFNVLDKDLANRLLEAMLTDSETWNRNRWWLFERMVESPHKTSYFAERDDDMEEVAGWTYNGKQQDPPRRFLPEMEEAKLVVRRIVNELRKQRSIHPYEVQGDWNCNVAAVNHYAHSKESVGFHADKLTYLGPRPTIGSLTLGVTRFFRIRKVIPDAKHPDTAGQLISIALPHNSLCIMWPPMQEEWKHEIPPVPTVTPHPISGTARINITFRLRREGFSPADTPVWSKMGQTCGQFSWVDMEQKLGLASSSSSPLAVNGGDGGGGGHNGGTESRARTIEATAARAAVKALPGSEDQTPEIEGGVLKHLRSSQSPEHVVDYSNHLDDKGVALDLADELQDDSVALEQQWEPIDEVDTNLE
ncbi:hypothetical protein BGZ95_010396 [Linnemannia exigua]|uniref:Fe2OG dioxygenase domain-containing protein n=1 Tax=Linnemannia exigua TaxID=604196 RepID=A0AAD4H6D6_9FUNG|nr:hypothetical protein BGZ95_010396 [Linnemannia exigua]